MFLSSSLPQDVLTGVFLSGEVSGGQRHILQAGVRGSDIIQQDHLRYLYRGPDCLDYSHFCSK